MMQLMKEEETWGEFSSDRSKEQTSSDRVLSRLLVFSFTGYLNLFTRHIAFPCAPSRLWSLKLIKITQYSSSHNYARSICHCATSALCQNHFYRCLRRAPHAAVLRKDSRCRCCWENDKTLEKSYGKYMCTQTMSSRNICFCWLTSQVFLVLNNLISIWHALRILAKRWVWRLFPKLHLRGCFLCHPQIRWDIKSALSGLNPAQQGFTH